MTLFFQTLRVVVGATIADFLYTPIWWYGRGLLKQFQGVGGSLASRYEAFAIDVWAKNLLVPMYGQYDVGGRIISFFVRLVQIIGRGIALVIWAAVLLIWLMAWVLVPVGIVYFVGVQIKSLLMSFAS